MFWIVGVINAMNLIDGLDGLAGGVALVAVITTFLISIQRGHPLMMLFSSALAGAIVGFLFYNFNPASIFMGDTGSMFLGFVLAATRDPDEPEGVDRGGGVDPRRSRWGCRSWTRCWRSGGAPFAAGRSSRPTRNTFTTA